MGPFKMAKSLTRKRRRLEKHQTSDDTSDTDDEEELEVMKMLEQLKRRMAKIQKRKSLKDQPRNDSLKFIRKKIKEVLDDSYSKNENKSRSLTNQLIESAKRQICTLQSLKKEKKQMNELLATYNEEITTDPSEEIVKKIRKIPLKF